ncbi:hypothetical protein PybrP1_010395 [[Pythium] brassicae (nom. inval.)]|nr:hypothetical protein PybrP1_010395 [[Pythium] brassicae (nom. inval.)]
MVATPSVFAGRRPVKVPAERLPSRLFRWLGARVDVVAQQVLDHDEGIFKAVKENDASAALRLVEANEFCLLLRDTVGAAPIHLAFLFGHFELGKALATRVRRFATLTYTLLDPDAPQPSPYHGENILHMAIVHREAQLARWLVREIPELLDAETTGKFFRPGKSCYFGGSPLLFALSSNQVPVALDILVAAAQLRATPYGPEAPHSTNDSRATSAPAAHETSIFMCDRFGNNALHMAVLHDLPNVYDFALQHAMQLLSPPGPQGAAGERAGSNDSTDSLFDFMKRAGDGAYDTMHAFLMQRNEDELTPLSLAAAIGNGRMFGHILQRATTVAWRYGPITAVHVPLLDLEQPIPRPDPDFGRFQVVHAVFAALPYPLAPKGTRGYKTAAQCLCSVEPLSGTLSSEPSAMQAVVVKRLEMLKLLSVKLLLHKKWKYVGKRRFLARLAAYVVYLVLLNAATLVKQSAYRTARLRASVALGVAETVCLGIAAVKFMNESNQLLFNFKSYTAESGAGRLDNVCTIIASVFLFLSAGMRAAGLEHLEDAFAAVALVFSWFYLFFFLLGFRSTGPFVIMILNMIANDIVRFIYVYVAVLVGFAQALYLVQDGRAGADRLLYRLRVLVIAGFTGEVNYDDNYTSGRMNTFTQVLMLAYVILVMILLVNLLIAIEILQESEQRWVAERANIMATIENQCTAGRNHADRKRYAIPLRSRRGEDDLFLEMEINDMDNWKTQDEAGSQPLGCPRAVLFRSVLPEDRE